MRSVCPVWESMTTRRHPSARHSIQYWYAIHKWSSLVCTLFLLLLCVTGLPLVFSAEIYDWVYAEKLQYVEHPAVRGQASLDDMVAESMRRYPKERVTSVFVDDDEPRAAVSMSPSRKAAPDDTDSQHSIWFDTRTGAVLKDSPPSGSREANLLNWVHQLHEDLFLGSFGELLLGSMAILFVLALSSGILLYGRFMKRLNFGTMRTSRNRRLKWLDLHNLLSIAMAAWMAVVGMTGLVNELSGPLFGVWQNTTVKEMLAPWQEKIPPQPKDLASVQQAFDTAQQAVSGMRIVSLVYPGGRFGSPHHYLLWAQGKTALTSFLYSPILVDAKTGRLTAVVKMPWYLRALELSRPLHYGNYGGVPLKIIWALLDVLTIVVLASGLYLWFARRKAMDARIKQLALGKNPP